MTRAIAGGRPGLDCRLWCRRMDAITDMFCCSDIQLMFKRKIWNYILHLKIAHTQKRKLILNVSVGTPFRETWEGRSFPRAFERRVRFCVRRTFTEECEGHLNKYIFYGVRLSATRPTPNLEDQGIPFCLGHHPRPIWHGRPYQ